MSKYIKFIAFAFVIGFFFATADTVSADTLNDYYEKLEDLEKQKDEYEKNKDSLNSEKAVIEKRIHETNIEVKAVGDELIVIEEEIDIRIEDIRITNIEIADTQQVIKEREAEIRMILRYFQKSRGVSQYLKFLFGSSDFNELARRYVVVTRLSDHNSEIIDEMEEALIRLDELETRLIAEKLDLENKEIEFKAREIVLKDLLVVLETDLIAIGEDISDISELAEDYDFQIESLKATIKFFEDAGCKKIDKLDSCVVGVPEDDKFYAPTDGGLITSNYGARCYYLNGVQKCGIHYAIDIAYGYNKVYSVAGGKVSFVVHDPYNLTAGGNTVMINHLVKGVKYTSVYHHLGSNILVDQGDVVTANTQIGNVGNSGYATTGAHLHFGMSYKWRYGTGSDSYVYYSDYKKYAIDPRKVLNFPRLRFSWYGRDIGYD